VRALWAEVYRQEATPVLVMAEVTTLLADSRAGAWRELVIDLLPAAPEPVTPPAPAREGKVLARLAAFEGVSRARQALTLALAQDGAWAPLLAGASRAPEGWTGPAAELAGLGLERDAARWYPHAFPAGSPLELAWSAATLAAWDNREAALSAGERLWASLGVPACLVPDVLLPRLVPPALVSGCDTAAAAEGANPSWLFGILRQESRFDHAARSQAGAIGIAQLVPETLRRLGASVADTADEQTSMRLAAREIVRLVQAFGPRLAVVAAAYNAGDPVVTSWLSALGPGASELLFAAAVPYRETSGYVLAVCEGALLARHLT
jgi:soluble lytic murein transglycosylase-like protein